MSKIQMLDEFTIQQIAAGEVIERPSSIVKELIENSIDAHASNITIEIKNGGKSYIRVTDNGDGMDKNDIELAFKRHSTSKLKTIDDIYNVLTLGFRGEALASISNVAKVEILSKIVSLNVGTQAFIRNGTIINSNSIGIPKGTTIIIRDIFYNFPVRQKFLKNSKAESYHIGEIINKLALGNPNISFRFIKDGSSVLKTSKNSSLSNTIYNVLGKDYYKNLIPINYCDDNFKINGFISNNNLYRTSRNHQYLYINGRYISNINISKIIEKEYRTLIPLNRRPVFILNIELNPNEIDINIHPTKQEVKFVDSEDIYEIITNIIAKKLISSIGMPEMRFLDNYDNELKKNSTPKLFEKINIEDNSSLDNIEINDKDTNIIIKDLTLSNYEDIPKNEYEEFRDCKSFSVNDPCILLSKQEEKVIEQKIENILLDIKPIGRIFNTYIIAESKNEEKLFFVDQHAAHERILYEKYKSEYENEKIITQELLYPVIIELTNEEMYMIGENKNIFESLGFILDEFGSNSVALRGVPMLFGEPQIKDLFMDILDGLSFNIQNNYETKIDKIMKTSCKNAIKSGDKIRDIEIIALFSDLKKCDNPYTCPHGRPTIIHLTNYQIERMFKRVV